MSKHACWNVTAGAEVEVWVYLNNEPFDLKQYLAPYGGVLEVVSHGHITVDIGGPQGEFVTVPSTTGEEVTAHLYALECVLHTVVPGCTIVYEPYMEDSTVGVADVLYHPDHHMRVRAQVDALIRESTFNNCAALSALGNACSTHVHIGCVTEQGFACSFNDAQHQSAALVFMSLFTNCGPYWAQWLVNEYRVKDDPRRQAVWFGFPEIRRQPRRGTWLYSWKEYEEYVGSSGPRLVKPRYDEETGRLLDVAVDLTTPSHVHDPVVQKTQWDQGRLSPLGTCEGRGAPSMAPQFVGAFVDKKLALAQQVLTYLGDHTIASSEDVRSMYTYLRAKMGDFMPPEPLSETEWSALAYLS